MTLTELRYVVALAREQHFGRAAEHCSVSQPTLSIAVKKLEEELDVVIFERSKNRVYATPLGEKLIQQSHRVLEHAKHLKDIAREGRNQLTSPLSVGAIFTVWPYLFPHLIPSLQSLAPDMPLYVEESFTGTLRQRLRQGELDAIVVSLPFTESDVVVQTLYEERFGVLVHRDHELAKHNSISSDQLLQENILLLGDGHCFRDQVFEYYPNLKHSINATTGAIRRAKTGSTLETLKYMVASKLGITILPESAALGDDTNHHLLVFIPFVDPQPKRTVALAWRASFSRPQAIDVLRQAVTQFAKTQNL